MTDITTQTYTLRQETQDVQSTTGQKERKEKKRKNIVPRSNVQKRHAL
jgi:hypothetical protein